MIKNLLKKLLIVLILSMLILPLLNTALASSDETFKMIQSHREINIVKGQGFTFEVGFKNLTNYTWTQVGAKSVDLKIAPPYNRETVVRHKFWRDTGTPAWLNEDQAQPGRIAYYRFALEAPQTAGVYTEKFVLVSYADGHILAGSEFQIVLNVWNSEAEFPKNLASNIAPKPTPAPTPSPTPTPSPEISFAQQCINLSTKKFRITTTVSQEFVQKCKEIGIDLSSNVWVDPQPTPAPVPTPTPTPTPTPQPTPTPTPMPTPATSDGPIVRIGLFNTTEPIVVTANAGYKLVDQNNQVLANLAANSQVTITYNFSTQQYSFTGTQSGTTNSYIKLTSDNTKVVWEIVSYELRPAWNTSLNDNKYLGDLEIRYASATNRLWVINQLAMEIYLQGLAETSNDSPIEYQKALVTAARTYAMHHYNRGTKHANENFTLDAKYDQVYKGYGSQIRLTKVVQAVQETKGMVVTYNGAVAITPYFSWSDGRTRSWSEVWGGTAVPWCVGVTEPAGYDKTTMFGHGVGMSARGALILAADHGYNYQQILKYYYTGVEVTKIY